MYNSYIYDMIFMEITDVTLSETKGRDGTYHNYIR